MSKIEKLTLAKDVDTAAVKEATVAIEALASAAERAKTALDALLGNTETFIHVSSDGKEEKLSGFGRRR